MHAKRFQKHFCSFLLFNLTESLCCESVGVFPKGGGGDRRASYGLTAPMRRKAGRGAGGRGRND